MPSFVYPALLAGLWIVAIPIVIHLINMLRHRRVQWAAMEFLLQSQKKNRTWIVMKQLLLLLLRMAVVALIVLMVARPKLPNKFGHLFGSTKTHHVVLLDDSFSMSDRWADTNAFDEAKLVIERIGTEAARRIEPQTFTLLRFSQARRVGQGTDADLLEQPIGSEFSEQLQEKLRDMTVSQMAAGPSQALQAVQQLVGEDEEERRIVYIISDFRTRQWDDPTDIQQLLLKLDEADAEIHLINCIENERPNLAITSLKPAAGIHAAGVPMFMEVAVKNFGTNTAKEVSVQLEEDGHGRPAVKIPTIPPGQTVTERFLVLFPNEGQHQTTARLQSDAIEVDNARYQALSLPSEISLLLVDGSPAAADARFIQMAASPGGAIRTGLRARIESPRFLSLNPLDEFRAVGLLNVDRLDQSSIAALQTYVEAGGGLLVFLGEQTDTRFFNNQLYRNGEGLFPVPLTGIETMLVDRIEKAPDISVDNHFIFRVFAGKRNTFLKTVLVERYFGVAAAWKPTPDSGVRVIARLRNGAPLVVERRVGEGRVLAVLTTAAPTFNNWARNPSFVIVIQDMLAYLSSRVTSETEHAVGVPWKLQFNPEQYLPDIQFTPPAEKAVASLPGKAVRTSQGLLTTEFAQTDTAGIYEARLTQTNGATETLRLAVNVNPEEGDLKAVSGPQLATRLEGVKFNYKQASMFQYTAGETEGSNIWEWLLGLLVLALIAEQILAWSAGYHPPARTAAVFARGGAR